MTHPPIRRILKRAVADLLWRLGVLRALALVRLRRRAVVFTYHRVLSDDAVGRTWSHSGMTVSAATFESHLRVLRTMFTPLSLEQFDAHLTSRRPFQGRACLVTFDDGWLDTLEEAAPLLRKYEVPAVVFVPVDCLGSPDGFWQERLGRQLHRAWQVSREFADQHPALAGVLGEYGLSGVLALGPETLRDDIRDRVAAVKLRGGAVARELVRRLGDVLGADELAGSPDRLLDRDGVRRLTEHGLAVGGHGATHQILTELTVQEASREARRAMAELSTMLTQPVLAYSYPNGDSNAEIAAVTEAAGFSMAFTTKPGHVSAADDKMFLPRINIHEGAAGTPAMFFARALGLF